MTLNDICKKVSKDLNEDLDLVTEIGKFQFKFITDVMKDDTDIHDILINKLIKFKIIPLYAELKKDFSPKSSCKILPFGFKIL